MFIKAGPGSTKRLQSIFACTESAPALPNLIACRYGYRLSKGVFTIIGHVSRSVKIDRQRRAKSGSIIGAGDAGDYISVRLRFVASQNF